MKEHLCLTQPETNFLVWLFENQKKALETLLPVSNFPFYWKVKSFIFRETLVVLWWPMMVASTLSLELCHGDMDVLKIIIQVFMLESLISLAGSTHTCLALYVHLLSSLKFQWIHNFVIIFKTFSLKKYMQISIIVSTWLKQK